MLPNTLPNWLVHANLRTCSKQTGTRLKYLFDIFSVIDWVFAHVVYRSTKDKYQSNKQRMKYRVSFQMDKTITLLVSLKNLGKQQHMEQPAAAKTN